MEKDNKKIEEEIIFSKESEVYSYLSNIDKRRYNVYVIKNNNTNKMRCKNRLWFEKLSQKDMENNNFYTDVKYTYLFIKEEVENNEVENNNEEKYRFLGLFKLIDYDKKNILRIWEKQK